MEWHDFLVNVVAVIGGAVLVVVARELREVMGRRAAE